MSKKLFVVAAALLAGCTIAVAQDKKKQEFVMPTG